MQTPMPPLRTSPARTIDEIRRRQERADTVAGILAAIIFTAIACYLWTRADQRQDEALDATEEVSP